MIDLKSILKQYPHCLSSRASFKSILMDKYPGERRMVNILTILFECGIADKIKAKSSISSNEMQGLITQVENEYGISAQYAQNAILVWAAAFGVTASTIKTQIPANPPRDTTPPVENKPVVYVQGDVDDYDVVQKPDGYYITRFNGFEEEEMTIPSLINGKPIKGIAQDAFQGCVMVKKISISEGIEIIENGAFSNCKALEAISLPDTLRRIGSEPTPGVFKLGAFTSTNIQSMVIPQNVEYLGRLSFASCYRLRKVELSDKITTIHGSTFAHCGMLSEIKLPRNLLVIEDLAFESCSGLREIHIPVGTQTIDFRAFDGTKLTSLYIPPTVTEIKSYVYFSESEIENLTIYCAAGSAAMEYARKNNIKCAKAQF